jgi:RES domain-containing protein
MHQPIPPGRDVSVQLVASLPRVPYQGHAFRHLPPHFDPRSGEGAKMQGGRFNPPSSFATLYLAPTLATAAAELFRLAEQHFIGTEALLPRDVYKYSVDLQEVIDLTDQDTEELLSVNRHRLTDNDRHLTHFLGGSAFSLGTQAIVSYSAADKDGLVIAVFPENLRGCDLRPQLVDSWTTIGQIHF